MFDGFKARCNLPPSVWLQNSQLEFIGAHNVATGEVLPRAITAECEGLKFTLTPSTIEPAKVHATLRGSLHKHFNRGVTNAGKYTLQNIAETLHNLKQRFGIEPQNAILENIEFGVNIHPPRPASWYIKNLVAHRNLRFCDLNIERQKVGKVCTRSDYSIKVYDKAKQTGNPQKNILRIEIAVKKMRLLQALKIQTLADIANPKKIAPLGCFLAKTVAEIVMFDKSVNEAFFTPKDLVSFLKLGNPLTWENYTKHQRNKQLKRFKKLCEKYEIEAPACTLSEMVLSEWKQLLGNPQNSDLQPLKAGEKVTKNTCENGSTTPEKGRPFHQLFEPLQHIKKATFSPLEYRVKKSPLSPKKEHEEMREKKKPENQKFAARNLPPSHPAPATPKKCFSCGNDISHQKPQSRFCSAKYFGEKAAHRCRNKASGKTRTFKRRLNHAESKGFYVVVSYMGESAILHPSEISVSGKLWQMIEDLKIYKPPPPA